MKIIKKTDELENILLSIKDSRKSIGLVLTMGNIHKGHLSLIKASQKNSGQSLKKLLPLFRNTRVHIPGNMEMA